MKHNKIAIKVRERVLRNNKGQLKVCYLTALEPTQKISDEVVLTRLSQRLSLPEPKVNYILSEVMDYIMSNMLQGTPIEVPQIGTFRLGMKSHAVSRKMDAGEKSIDKITINYLPTLKSRKLLDLNNLQFKLN